MELCGYGAGRGWGVSAYVWKGEMGLIENRKSKEHQIIRELQTNNHPSYRTLCVNSFTHLPSVKGHAMPAGQTVQLVEPPSENVPEVQLLQAVASRASFAYFEASQFIQEEAPGRLAIFPLGQAVHSNSSAREYRPG